MKIVWLGIALVGCPLVLACDKAEEPPPTVEGQPPAEAAEVSTEVACDYAVRCGQISVTCADCADASGCGGCFAEHFPVTQAACEAELQGDLQAGFACEELTAEEEADIDACLAALPDLACPTVEAVEAWGNGGGGDDPRDPPAGCDTLEDVRYRCADGGAMTPTPLPPP